MRTLRVGLFCLFVLGISAASVEAQTENTAGVQGRHITGKQIIVLAKALANQPKGTIWMDGLGFFPSPTAAPTPPPQLPTSGSPILDPLIKTLNEQSVSTKSEFEEAKAFSVQLWNVLQVCGYDPKYPDGSHGIPPKGISIRVIHHKSRPIAEALRESLLASGIKDIQIEEDPKEETYYSMYFPSFKVLMEITIGTQ